MKPTLTALKCRHAVFVLTLLWTLSGCRITGREAVPAPGDAGTPSAPFRISLMVPTFALETPTPESIVWKKIEEYTNTKLDISWVPNSSYSDRLNMILAAGSMPAVIEAGSVKLPSIAGAIKAGDFWEIGPYLGDYPNLRQANSDVIGNISFGGKLYAIYRGRPIGRMAVSYRKDWLDNVGLPVPVTIDDFYAMLRAFTYEDPDRNGKEDTYGMQVTRFGGPWDVMQIWFGAPNKWGTDEAGRLVPDFFTPEYRNALRFFHRLFEEKLVNADFPIADPSKWNEPVVNGLAGVVVDVAGRSYQIDDALKKVDPKGEVDVISAVSGPKGLRNLPTSGYNGVFLISKSAVKTEAELRKVLAFMDKLNDKEMQILLNYGVEGIHYKTDNGKLTTLLQSDEPQKAEYRITSMGQLLMYIPDRLSRLFSFSSPLHDKADRVQEENEKIVISNPAEPLLSSTYSQKGSQLDTMIDDARTKFIVGKMDEAGFQDAVELWRRSGGDDYIKEINEAYRNSKN